MVKRAQHGIYGYPVNVKTFEQSIINWQKKRFGWDVDLNWVEYTPAVIPAIIYAMQAFTQPGDNIVVQMPAYHPFHAIIPNSGRHILGNKLILQENGSYDIDFANLEELLSQKRTSLNCQELNMAPEDLQKFFLEQAKVAMNEGSAFGPGGVGFMRMNIACPRSRLVEALDRMEAAINKL